MLALGLACEESLPAPIRTTIVDITDGEAVDALVNGLSTLDVVVNAAGIIRRDDEFDLDVFGRVVEVNLIGVMRVCKAAHAKLCASRGAIINIASMLSFFGGARTPDTAPARAELCNLLARWQLPGQMTASA